MAAEMAKGDQEAGEERVTCPVEHADTVACSHLAVLKDMAKLPSGYVAKP